MDDDLKQFENYLREFEPRRPRDLPIAASMVRRAAAGVLAVVLCAGALWVASHSAAPRTQTDMLPPSKQRPFLSAAEFTRLALDDPRAFDKALVEVSRRVLPQLESSESTLRVLAKP